MNDKLPLSSSQRILLAGDAVTFAVVTLFGFASHGTLGSAGVRMLSTFVPVLVAWLLIAPFLGVYDLQQVGAVRHLWRPFWAMILAAPMAAWLRGVWLGTPVQLVFVIVLGGISALAILVWRSLYTLYLARKKPSYG